MRLQNERNYHTPFLICQTHVIWFTVNMSNNILKILLKLYIEFKKSTNLTSTDYIQELKGGRRQNLDQNEGDQFLLLIKHEQFLLQISERFISAFKLRRVNVHNISVLFYYTIFILDETNVEILNIKCFYIKFILQYLIEEDNIFVITTMACKLFENNYVLDKIVYPLLNKTALIKLLLENITEAEINKTGKKPVTIAQEFKGLGRHISKTPPPPVNTPEELKFRANAIPDKIKNAVSKIPHLLAEEREKNREKAQKLLEEANTMSTRLVEPKKSFNAEEEIRTKIFKANKVPPKKEVEIKGNLTTTLREASRIIKEQENEIKEIEEIVKGGYNMEKIEQLELEEKRRKNQLEIEAIERKHLQSLLTYEEAILAKKKLLEDNKKKALEIKEAKLELLEELERWKEEEQSKIKALVEKTQKDKKDAKESERKLQEEKQTQVRLLQYETKELLRKSYEEKQKELARKMELIQEIKTLHQLHSNMNVKEFDPTECPNFGLLCEMSIAELQERIAMAKIKMKEELEEKRKRILKRKDQQQKMVENVKNFIAQTRRMSKPRIMPICTTKLEQSPDLIELRRQLEEKRNLRMKTTEFL